MLVTSRDTQVKRIVTTPVVIVQGRTLPRITKTRGI